MDGNMNVGRSRSYGYYQNQSNRPANSQLRTVNKQQDTSTLGKIQQNGGNTQQGDVNAQQSKDIDHAKYLNNLQWHAHAWGLRSDFNKGNNLYEYWMK